MKDICPRCNKLKEMPEMNYGRYKAICHNCESELMSPSKNVFLFGAVLVCIIMTIVIGMELNETKERLTRIQVKLNDVESKTSLLNEYTCTPEDLSQSRQHLSQP